MPRFVNSCVTSGSLKIARTSLFRSATISGGVPAGATIICQAADSKPAMPASCMVGTSGVAGERFAVDTASARSLPSRICGTTDGPSPNSTCSRPARRSVSAGGVAL